MAIVSFTPGRTDISLLATVRVSFEPQPIYEPPGGLYPMRSAAYELNEYRIMAGWPVPVPPYDVHNVGVVSATGERITGREDPLSLTTNAVARWVADEDYYNTTTLTWVAVQRDAELVWKTSTDYTPTFMSGYEYRVGDERIYRNALNFDSDTRDHMWCDLERVLGGSAGYTVIMVVSLNSVYGNNVDVPYNGLWCPGRATPAGETFAESIDPNWMSVTVQGQYLWFETESDARQAAIPVYGSLSSPAPFYLAMVFGRPETHFYAGPGPSNLQVKTMKAGLASVPLDNGVVLGRGTGDVLHTADMALFDLGIYANPLSAAEIRDEFSKLSRVYGGDS